MLLNIVNLIGIRLNFRHTDLGDVTSNVIASAVAGLICVFLTKNLRRIRLGVRFLVNSYQKGTLPMSIDYV